MILKNNQSYLLKDFVFFLLVVAIPSSFFNFVNRELFFDLRAVYMFVGFGFLLLYFRHLPKITKLNGGKLLIVVSGFVGLNVIYSLFIHGIHWMEVAIVFRSNFYSPIATLGFLLYACKMNNRRITRFLRWILIVTFVSGIFYLISNLTGIDIYANQSKDFPEIQGLTIVQNLLAIPDYNIILYALAVFGVMAIRGYNKHWLWFIPLTVAVLSIVRSQIIVFFLTAIVLFFLGSISNLKLRSLKVISASIVAAILAVLVLQFFPAHITGIVDKFGINQQTGLNLEENLEQGTYNYRLLLIEESYKRTERAENLFFGNGYTRESYTGGYDFALGGDTLVAPVLWAEGVVGLLLRMLPILYFLWWGIKHLKNSDWNIIAISIIIVGLVLPQLVNFVQTKIFTSYHQYIFIIYLFMLLIYNKERYDDSFDLKHLL